MAMVSVVLCTRNPRPDLLKRVLSALAAQTLPRSDWELLVVDNGSERPVADVYDLSWHPRGRHVREDETGLTRARCRGIDESVGDPIVFVDDDNVLAPDYLEEALLVREDDPRLGVFGSGSITPEFEVEPPEAIRVCLPLLAIRDVPAPFWSNHAADATVVPWGAGLVVGRTIADQYGAFTASLGIESLLARRGNRLYCGEDDLFSWLAASLGFDFGIFPQLRLTHVIPQERLRRGYIVRLLHDHALSSSVRLYLLTGEAPARFDWFAWARLLLHGLRRGRHAMRFNFAYMSGTEQAAKFIVRNGLEPVSIAPPLSRERAATAARVPSRRSSSR